jgi:hypothetical protein
MHVLGFLDDRRGLSPWARLGVQVVCATILAMVGIRISLFLPGEWLHGILTVLFIVAMTNAVNFIDNMNGLMGGVVLIGALPGGYRRHAHDHHQHCRDQSDRLGQRTDIPGTNPICNVMDFNHMQNLEKRFNARSLCSLETQRRSENI